MHVVRGVRFPRQRASGATGGSGASPQSQQKRPLAGSSESSLESYFLENYDWFFGNWGVGLIIVLTP